MAQINIDDLDNLIQSTKESILCGNEGLIDEFDVAVPYEEGEVIYHVRFSYEENQLNTEINAPEEHPIVIPLGEQDTYTYLINEGILDDIKIPFDRRKRLGEILNNNAGHYAVQFDHNQLLILYVNIKAGLTVSHLVSIKYNENYGRIPENLILNTGIKINDQSTEKEIDNHYSVCSSIFDTLFTSNKTELLG